MGEIWRGKLARYPLRRGDLVRLVTGIGGGNGLPMMRAPEAVKEDVQNGFITTDQSRQLYGVVLDAETLEIDAKETQMLRRRKTDR
jgi:N-methylhydantoinase B